MSYGSSRFYYVNYKILRHCLWLTITQGSLRLWLMVIGFLPLYFLHQALLLALRLLDELFYADYRKVKITAPVFVIANPRSGTTYLQRLLSLEETHYTSMRLLDTLFPAVCFHKFMRVVNQVDKRCGQPINRLLAKLDHLCFGGWDEIHPMGFTKAEEDENLFFLPFMSAGVCLLFPFVDKVTENHFLDDCPAATRQQMMDFYENCLQRFVYATGPNKTYLTKNVFSSGRIQTLLARFPDAKIIYIARNPYEALPSFVSMFSAMYQVHSPSLPFTAPAYRAWAEMGMVFYQHCLTLEETLPADAFYALTYESLLRSPQETVIAIFHFFHWHPSARFLQRLGQEQARQANYQSKHHYSLEKYGLQKAEINAKLRAVFAKYQWTIE
ncbi:MAG: sulfotransferase family protein [Caldilineaceae bacterium]